MDFPISISVIMTTYNTEKRFLKEAVESILNQTFRDFEFLIIDDGTTNGSDAYLNEITDERVRIIRNASNVGITRSLNIGLREARGKYIARMDADDVSFPERFEKEFAYLEANPGTVVCGSKTGPLSAAGKAASVKKNKKAESIESYRVKLLFINPGPTHPSAMIRHEVLLENHILYDEELIHSQDYGLWEVLSRYGRIHVLDEALIYRRKHKDQVSSKRRDIQIKCDKITQKRLLTELLGEVTDEEVDLHYFCSTGYFKEAELTPEIKKWYDRLIEANRTKGIYDQKLLEGHIVNIKKMLIRHSYTPDMPFGKRFSLIFKHLSFGQGMRMVAGNIRRGAM